MASFLKKKSYFVLIIASICFIIVYICFIYSSGIFSDFSVSITIDNMLNLSNHSSLTLNDQISNKNVILTFCNDKYIEVFNLWYSFYSHLSDLAHNDDYILLLLALDTRSYNLFHQCIDKSSSNILIINALHLDVSESCGIPSDFFYENYFNEEEKLARFRHCVVKTLLIQTQSITMTDIDALWLQNPFKFFSSHSIDNDNVDIISSTGTWPKNCHSFRKYERRKSQTYNPRNFCMGFAYFRNTKAANYFVSAFWNSLKAKDELTGSDQQPFNCFIHDTLKRKKQYFDDNKTVTFVKYKGNKYDLMTVALDQRYFVRNCQSEENLQLDNVYILHCWMDKVLRAKLNMQNITGDPTKKLRYWIREVDRVNA